jgi:hypothetical protein
MLCPPKSVRGVNLECILKVLFVVLCRAEYEDKLAQKSSDLAILNDKLKVAKSSPKSSKKNAVTVFESVDDKITTVSRDELCQLVKLALENKKKTEVEEKVLKKEIGPEDANLKPPKKTIGFYKVDGIMRMLNTSAEKGEDFASRISCVTCRIFRSE